MVWGELRKLHYLKTFLMFSPCGPHLSSRCEKCMSSCIALRLDIDSITQGAVVGCLNEGHSLTLSELKLAGYGKYKWKKMTFSLEVISY